MPFWIKFGQILNMWLRTFSHLCHVCYSLCFIRYFIIGFRCGVEFCFYNWKEKINIMGYEEGFKRNAAYPHLQFFWLYPHSLSRVRGLDLLYWTWDIFSQINLLYFCLILRRLHFPFSHGFHFGLIIFKTKCSRSLTKLQPKSTQFSKMFYVNINYCELGKEGG